ncbi:MAG: ketoacyl-ACP synthase III [Rickettsiales bacterium]|jgi:3-oxoacyl-[acyl-carrier-protein] synthase-3|nr:ketoacyl-ACP synthase III [Rickettsiales bacterium]
MMFGSKLVGYGYYAPEKIVPNAGLEKLMDTTDEWILIRTGIRQRHIARDDEGVVDMAEAAVRRSLGMAKLEPDDIDCIIFATISGKRDFPAEAEYLYSRLGMTNNAPAFDVKAACTGFVYAMHIARAFFAAGMYRRILIVGSEKMSQMVDWTDRNTAVLFGDGAGAMIFERTEEAGQGIVASEIFSDGANAGLLYSNDKGHVCMDGKEVYKHAVRNMGAAGLAVLESAGMTKDDIDWLLPHQANMRIIISASEKIGFPMDKVITNVDKFANTSGASGALALAYAAEQGLIKPGQRILYTAFGAGLTWGAAVIKM